MENQKSTEHWPKLDLIEGKVKSYFSLENNEIYTQEYNKELSLFLSILTSFGNPCSLLLIITLIVVIVLPDSTPYHEVMYSVELALIILSTIGKEIFTNNIIREADTKINKRVAHVFRGKEEFEKMEWGKIKQGDIVYLTQGQTSPADIIILDSQQIEHREAISYVDVKQLNGTTVCEKKKSCYLTQLLNRSSTQKRVWQEYRKIISGRITYEKPSNEMDSFTGYLKLTKDPKVEKLSIENLILRESTIKTSLWVYGLVVYTGMQSKVMKSFKEGHKNRKWIISASLKMFLLLFLGNLVLSMLFSILYACTGVRYESLTFIVSYHFLMFSTMLPYLLFFAEDVLLILLRWSKKNSEIEIRDYKNFQELGEITYAVISNVGVLTDGKLEVNEIVTESSIYAFDSDDGQFESGDSSRSNGLHGRRMGSSAGFGGNGSAESVGSGFGLGGRGRNVQNKFLLPIMNYDKRSSALVFKEDDGVIESENFEIDDDTNIRLKEYSNSFIKTSKLTAHLEPLKLDKGRFYNYVKRNENESTEIIKALGLCHQAKLYYDSPKDRYVGVSNVNSEEILLKLVNYVGWKIMPKMIDKKEVGITIFEEKEKICEDSGLFSYETVKTTYYYSGVNSFHISRKLFSVVVNNEEKSTLYCKGRPEDIMERLKLSKETQKIIDQTISAYTKKQSEIIIYAKREFTEEERDIYENDYISLKSSLTTTEAEIEEFSKRYEKNLEFICVIGMSTQINTQADPLIKHIRSSGIKPCIFVQDKSETISMKKLVMAEGEEYRDLELEGESADILKYYLSEVARLLNRNEEFKYILTMSGSAWKIIQSDSEIMQHFLFALFYSQALIANRFESEDIMCLTHKIRTSYPEKQKVLAIGYSYTDLKFLGESDVSISTCQDLPTDIKVDSLNKIIKTLKMGPVLLMIKLCKNETILYRVVNISVITLVYEIILSFYSTSQTINGHLVFIYLVISTLLELAYQVFNLNDSLRAEEELKYQNFKEVKKRHYLRVFEAFIHGTIIILSLYFNLPGVKIYGAKLLPVEALDMAVFICIILVGSMRNFFNSHFSRLSFIVSTFITIATMSLSVFICSKASSKFQKVSNQFIYLFIAYDSIVAMINCLVFCLAISFFLEEIIKKRMTIESERAKTSDTKRKHIKKSMIEIIRHLFRNEENIENSLKDIVASEINVNEFKITTYLQIKNEEEDIKFLSQRIDKNADLLIRLSFIMALLFVAIFAIDVLFIEKMFIDYQAICIVGFVMSVISFVIMCYKREFYMFSYVYISFVMISITFFLLFYDFKAENHHDFILICLIAIVITQNININFFVLIFLFIVLFVAGTVLAIREEESQTSKAIYPIYEIIYILFNLYLFYQVELESRMSFVNTEAFEKETSYVNDILSILVPKFIKNHLEGNEFALQQEQKKVSILFCYVCNFDEIVKEEGTNVVTLMDELFRQFDQLCHNFAVQKIETVGQTYMAATGIKAYEDEIETEMKKRNQVERLLKMAIQMLEKSKDIMWGTKKNKKLNIKIGIHHGNVMIGVIGFHKPQFSLIGDAVNTTSRHCSTAGPGEIVVSSVAFELLRKFPASAFSKTTKNMKGLGEVPVYKYNNNIIKEQSHLRLRIKFQNAVKKLIEQLKAEGKIHYKKFKASEFAEKVMFYERRNTKKMTKISEPRRSLQFDSFLLDPVVSSKENKLNEVCLKYNKLLELEEKNSKFKKDLITKHLKSDRFCIGVLALVYLINYLVDLAMNNHNTQSLALTSIGIIIFPIMAILYKNSIKHLSVQICFMIAHCYLIIAVNLTSIMVYHLNFISFSAHIGNFYSIMAVTVCSAQKAFSFLHAVILAVVSLTISVTILIVNNKFDIAIIYQIFIFSLILLRKYNHLKEYYTNYNQSQIYEKKSLEQSALVSQLLPKHAYEKLKNNNIENKLELTDCFESTTMLYADIKGFTSYSNQNTPAQVVKMLRELFEEFDKLCLKYNVYKVYTIGDCYVVLGFTNCYQRDYLQEAKNVVNMGLAMVETIQRVRERLNFEELDMRIGIHTGTIIGGIIGTDIVRYDIYGPDVMVANKFEEYGKTGFIHISEATKEILDEDRKKSFNIVPNGVVKVEKLNAEYNGYILTKKKFEI